MTSRTILCTVPATAVREGGGFLVHRPFPTRALIDVDPFLMLDELGPVDYAPGEAVGAPEHPHKGFEIITYLLRGENEHKDSFGHRGTLREGDAQYMLAGAGVVHEEMPAQRVLDDGGRVHGIQLWINLPRADKALRPRYVDIRADAIPVHNASGGAFTAKIIAGAAFGLQGAVETKHAADYLHLTIAPGGRAEVPVAAGRTVLAYVIDGRVRAAATREMRAHELAIFADDGESIVLENTGADAADAIVLASAPIGEPVARYGPFVMNTEDEIHAAFEEYRNGTMGRIEPEREAVTR